MCLNARTVHVKDKGETPTVGDCYYTQLEKAELPNRFLLEHSKLLEKVIEFEKRTYYTEN